MMKYSYEFNFDGDTITSIRKWNKHGVSRSSIREIVSPRSDDWSDIFSCRVFLSNKRVIIYNEKFHPCEEDLWFRYQKLNNLYAIHRVAKSIELTLSESQKADWVKGYRVSHNDLPLSFDRIEIRRGTDQREYLVLDSDNFYVCDDPSNQTYKRSKGINTPIGQIHPYNVIFYPLVFKNIGRSRFFVCANPPLGFSSYLLGGCGRFYNLLSFTNSNPNYTCMSYSSVTDSYPPNAQYANSTTIINSFDTLTLQNGVGEQTQAFPDDLSRGICVHLHHPQYFPAVLSDSIEKFNVMRS